MHAACVTFFCSHTILARNILSSIRCSFLYYSFQFLLPLLFFSFFFLLFIWILTSLSPSHIGLFCDWAYNSSAMRSQLERKKTFYLDGLTALMYPNEFDSIRIEGSIPIEIEYFSHMSPNWFRIIAFNSAMYVEIFQLQWANAKECPYWSLTRENGDTMYCLCLSRHLFVRVHDRFQ